MGNVPAFEERESCRDDHFRATGMLVHPNCKNERVDGVAVTDDVPYRTGANYDVGFQISENLVAISELDSIPEELLLSWYEDEDKDDQLMQRSSQTENSKLLHSGDHLNQLSKILGRVDARFAHRYGHDLNEERFAIECKITWRGELAINQASRWGNSKVQP